VFSIDSKSTLLTLDTAQSGSSSAAGMSTTKEWMHLRTVMPAMSHTAFVRDASQTRSFWGAFKECGLHNSAAIIAFISLRKEKPSWIMS
jgi:hypothetical protein